MRKILDFFGSPETLGALIRSPEVQQAIYEEAMGRKQVVMMIFVEEDDPQNLGDPVQTEDDLRFCEVMEAIDGRREPENDGWIAWNGGKCPVPLETNVSIRLRSGLQYHSDASKAGDWYWRHGNIQEDIIAYKVLPDSEVIGV